MNVNTKPRLQYITEEHLVFSVAKAPNQRPRLHAAANPAVFPCGKCDSSGGTIITKGDYDFWKPCDCQRIPEFAANITRVGLPGSAMNARLAEYRLNGNRPSLDRLEGWAGDFSPGARGKVMTGGNGVGKTWIGQALALALALRGFTVRWVRWVDLLADIKHAYASKQAEETVTLPLLDCDLLVIDDLGAEQSTEWAHVACERILGSRLEDGATTIITTNATRDQLVAIVGDRVYSRMVGACDILELRGLDLRADRD